MVWGERLPRDPMRTLEAYVSVLRDRLAREDADGDWLLRSESRAYRVALDEVEFDLHEFDDLVSRAAAAPSSERLGLQQRALAMVRGELLADEPYADWLVSLRDLYSERHLQLLLDTADDCLAAGRTELAAGYAEQVLATQPTRERAHRLLVAAHYASGDQDRALAAYDRCRRVLDEELGVRPLPQTERVYLAVLNQAPAEAVRPAARAPALASPNRRRPGSPTAARRRSRTRWSVTARSTWYSRTPGSRIWRLAGRSRATRPSCAAWPGAAG